MDRGELRVKAEEAAARLRQLPIGGAGESQLAAVYGDHDWKTLQELELRDRWLLADAWMVDNWPAGYDSCAELAAVTAERDKLKEFKAYVHARLDAAGVPVDPDSPHKAEGCRIGGRLDVLLGERERLRGWLRLAIQAMDRYVPINQYPVELDAARDTLEGGGQ